MPTSDMYPGGRGSACGSYWPSVLVLWTLVLLLWQQAFGKVILSVRRGGKEGKWLERGKGTADLGDSLLPKTSYGSVKKQDFFLCFPHYLLRKVGLRQPWLRTSTILNFTGCDERKSWLHFHGLTVLPATCAFCSPSQPWWDQCLPVLRFRKSQIQHWPPLLLLQIITFMGAGILCWSPQLLLSKAQTLGCRGTTLPTFPDHKVL